MHKVGGYDGEEIHALGGGQLGFFLYHLLVAAVGALRGNAKFAGRLCRLLGIGTEAATNQFYQAVQIGRHTVYGTDKGTGASTQHSHLDFLSHDDVVL